MVNGKRTIGILTGGGDCPGLNAVIRAAVRTARSEHDLDVVEEHSEELGWLTCGSARPQRSRRYVVIAYRRR